MWSSCLCTVDGGVRCFFFFLRGGLIGSAGCLAASLTCSQSRNTVHDLLSLWQKTLHSNLRRKDLFDLVISEVSSHGHLALLLLTLCIAEHKSWLRGDGGEQSSLHQDGQEAERGTHGRKVEENTLQKHAFLPSDTPPPIGPISYFPHLQKCSFITIPSREQSTD